MVVPIFAEYLTPRKKGIIIWYLLTCQGREEHRILTICRERLSRQAALEAFVLTCDRLRRYEGSWHLERKLLFPECVFMDSENQTALEEELREYNIADMQKRRLLILSLEEEDFLKKLCGSACHLRMSKGIITRGVTQITEGPLRGMENRICKIDRHKRLARVQTVIGRECRMIPAGLEITEKN